MKKNRQSTRPLRVSATAAVLIAVSIVCGKFLQFPVGEALRFSFENLPILLAGALFGPLTGGLVGVLADLIGSVLHGYAINPFITLGAAAIGVVGGGMFRWTVGLPCGWQVTLAVSAAHLIGSVGIKTVGIAAYYAMPFAVLLLWRLLNYAIVGVAEGLLLAVLLKNKALRAAADRKGGAV